MTRKTVQLKDLQVNSTYSVQVRAVNSDNETGPWSTQLQFSTLTDSVAPGPVTGLTGSVEGAAFKISYTKPTIDENGDPLDDLRDIEIKVYPQGSPGQAVYFYTEDTQIALPFDTNKAAFAGAKPDLTFEVRARDWYSNLSTVSSVNLSNPGPTAPTLVATAKRNAVELKWNDTFDGDGAYFEIWKDAAKYATVAPATLVWTDTDVGSGSHNYYVKAVDLFGNSADSNTVTEAEVSIGAGDVISPKPPTGLAYADVLSSDGSDVVATLSWDAPTQDTDNSSYSDNEGFQVRYRKDLGRPWTYMSVTDERADASVPQNFDVEVLVESGGSLYWGVRAYDRSGNYSTWADLTSSVSQDTVAPSAPTGVTASGGIRSINVKWNKNGESDLAGYILYVDTASPVASGTATVAFDGLGTSASFAANDNETWYARVVAYDNSGNTSPYSAEVSATTLVADTDTTPPSDVANLTLAREFFYHGSTEQARIIAEWDDATDNEGLLGYIVAWQKVETGGSPVASGWVEDFVADQSRFVMSNIQLTDANLPEEGGEESLAGATYYFRVKAVDKSGNVSTNWTPNQSIAIEYDGGLPPDGGIQDDVVIKNGGAIRSENFINLSQGFRLDSDSLEIYGSPTSPVSLSLGNGGTGLNLSTLDDRLWFGSSDFTTATWRVDTAGNMRVGASGAFYVNASGDVWSGDTNPTQAPWLIDSAGEATFRNIHIEPSTAMTDGSSLISVADSLGGPLVNLRKIDADNWEFRLATDTFIDAGGLLELNGGSILLTSGNVTMNGGTFEMAGGAFNLTGAPINLQGSDFTIETGNIILASGDATTALPTGIIQSSNYDYNSKTGWALDNGNLYLFDGEIDAALINVRNAQNLLEYGYTTMPYVTDWYNRHINTTGTPTVSLSSLWSRYGENGLRVQGTTGDTVSFVEHINTFPDYDKVRVEPGGTYVFSAYVYNMSVDPKGLKLVVTGEDASPIKSETFTIPGESSQRVHFVATMNANVYGAYTGVELVDAASDFILDGLQFEEGTDEPSPFNIGGGTTIDAGAIQTGSITSNNFQAYDPNTPGSGAGFRITMDGDVEFNSGIFRGQLFAEDFVAGTIDNQSFLLSSIQSIVPDAQFDNGWDDIEILATT